MTEEIKSVSEMIRITAENQNSFLLQVAEHIDKLEATIVELQNRLSALETKNE